MYIRVHIHILYVVGISRIESYRSTGTQLAFGNTYEISSNEVTRYSYNVHFTRTRRYRGEGMYIRVWAMVRRVLDV